MAADPSAAHARVTVHIVMVPPKGADARAGSGGTAMSSTMPVDQTKLEELVHQAVVDFGATISSALVVIGDKLGLYKAMVGAGPLTPAELAARTGTDERYV